ncbi:MAG: DNA-3-methyladenine glycosylase I [Ruminococcaceae bacterium]|nr:DNA-3-methyladenine glycosylase I [Oscillospiraceae bacterium]
MKPQNAARLSPCEAFGKNTGNFVRETNTALWGVGVCGSTIIYSFLQAVGVINSHDDGCDLYGK